MSSPPSLVDKVKHLLEEHVLPKMPRTRSIHEVNSLVKELRAAAKSFKAEVLDKSRGIGRF